MTESPVISRSFAKGIVLGAAFVFILMSIFSDHRHQIVRLNERHVVPHPRHIYALAPKPAAELTKPTVVTTNRLVDVPAETNAGKTLENPAHLQAFQKMYEVYHRSRRTKCDGCRYIPFYDRMWPGYKSVYDAGAANCGVLKAMKKKGLFVRGIEFSRWVVEEFCSDIFNEGLVEIGPLHTASTGGRTYDLVLCTDVLEHVPEQNVDASISKLADLATPGGHVFLIIASDPSKHENHPERSSSFAVSNEGEYKVHETVKNRNWWLAKLASRGLFEDRAALRSMLDENAKRVKDPRFGFTSEKGKYYPPNPRHVSRVYTLVKK